MHNIQVINDSLQKIHKITNNISERRQLKDSLIIFKLFFISHNLLSIERKICYCAHGWNNFRNVVSGHGGGGLTIGLDDTETFPNLNDPVILCSATVLLGDLDQTA